MTKVPHPIPYQGSKRKLAPTIYNFVRKNKYNVLYEPFVGSGAFTIFAAKHNLAQKYVIGDSLSPLVNLWEMIVDTPNEVVSAYEKVWKGQKDGDFEYYNQIRSLYNENKSPVLLLYLIVRCVKNAVRFGQNGNFTQSSDKRRKGMRPEKMKKAVLEASCLLKGKVEFFSGDFSECLINANRDDLVYMDPPYQGTSYGRDKRYFEQITVETLCAGLTSLNTRNIDYLLSYDGKTGEKVYGVDLPESLELNRVFIDAGRSSQSTLNGESEITLESLYISPSLANRTSYAKDDTICSRSEQMLLPLQN